MSNISERLSSAREKIAGKDDRKRFENLIAKHAKSEAIQYLVPEDSDLKSKLYQALGQKPEIDQFCISPVSEFIDINLKSIQKVFYFMKKRRNERALAKEKDRRVKKFLNLIAATLIKNGKEDTLLMLQERPLLFILNSRDKNNQKEKIQKGYKLVEEMSQDFSPQTFGPEFARFGIPSFSAEEKAKAYAKKRQEMAIQLFAKKLEIFEFENPNEAAKALVEFATKHGSEFENKLQDKDVIINYPHQELTSPRVPGLGLYKKGAIYRGKRSNSPYAVELWQEQEKWCAELQQNPEFLKTVKEGTKICIETGLVKDTSAQTVKGPSLVR